MPHPRGGRLASTRLTAVSAQFQSTHPHEVRPQLLPVFRGAVRISTHAPAQGATSSGYQGESESMYFNPRPRTGCDLSTTFLAPNPPLISIPAPAQGATNVPITAWNAFRISIPAPAQGATVHCAQNDYGSNISIPAPAQGATANLYKSEYLFYPLLYLLYRPLSIFSQFLLPPILFFHFLLFCQREPAGKSLRACHSHCLERRSLLSVFSKRPLPARARVGGGSAAAKMALCLGRQKAAPALSSASRRP